MHIKLDRDLFLSRLELVGKVSTKHATLPVLQCVLLEVKDKSLYLTATNLEIGIEAILEVSVTATGKAAVPAQVLLQTTQQIKHKEISLKVDEGSLLVEARGSKTKIKLISAEEFPSIPKLEEAGQVANRSLFAQGIRTAALAASQSSIKPELASVYVLQKKEHSLSFVATDSFRLMEKTVPQKGLILNDPVLIPHKNALDLARVCEALESNPELRVNENQCALAFSEGVYVTSRLTNGSFPDYEAIIPKEYQTHVTLLKEDLTQVFKKTNIFLNKFLQVNLAVKKSELIISADNGEVGTTKESINAQTDGEEITLNFNQRYLSDPLPYISDESLVLRFAGLGRPLVFGGAHDNSLRYLVMPMNK